MTSPNKKSLFIVTLFVIQFALMSISCASGTRHAEIEEDKPPTSEEIRLEVELDKETYNPGEEILVRCRFQNVSERTVNLAPTLFMYDLSAHLERGDGQAGVSFHSKRLLSSLLIEEDIIELGPGDYLTYEDTYYGMPAEAGKYNLYVTYTNRVDEFKGMSLWKGEVRSNAVRYEIKESRM